MSNEFERFVCLQIRLQKPFLQTELQTTFCGGISVFFYSVTLTSL